MTHIITVGDVRIVLSLRGHLMPDAVRIFGAAHVHHQGRSLGDVILRQVMPEFGGPPTVPPTRVFELEGRESALGVFAACQTGDTAVLSLLLETGQVHDFHVTRCHLLRLDIHGDLSAVVHTVRDAPCVIRNADEVLCAARCTLERPKPGRGEAHLRVKAVGYEILGPLVAEAHSGRLQVLFDVS